MRENATEIKKVLDEHQYSINAIIFEVMGTFKLKSISSFAPSQYGVLGAHHSAKPLKTATFSPFHFGGLSGLIEGL